MVFETWFLRFEEIIDCILILLMIQASYILHGGGATTMRQRVWSEHFQICVYPKRLLFESLVMVRRLSVTALGGRRRLKSGLAHLALQGITLNYLVPPVLSNT